jgi:raffinose/stachyose/melibiose transport system permease protein
MASRVSRHVVLIFICMFYLVPLYLVTVNSLKTSRQFLLGPMDLPLGSLTLANYEKALNNPILSMPAAIGFSVFFAVSTVVFAILLGGGLSYLIARARWRGARIIYLAMVAGLIIPQQVLVIPIVKVLQFLGLLFTVPGLVLVEVSVNLPFVVFILVPFIRAIPVELDESAQIDGATSRSIYWKIILPVVRPAIVSIGVLVFAGAWNDFINPQVLLRPGDFYTVTTGIYRAVGQYTTDWGSVFANVMLAAAPVLIIFVSLQRFVVGGLTRGAVKG